MDDLEELDLKLEGAAQEVEAINIEEELLGWEKTQFGQLADITAAKEPYDRLWRTGAEFQKSYNKWMHGCFLELEPEAVEADVGNMWRAMYKLTKTFTDQIGPRRVAEAIKTKLDKFKVRSLSRAPCEVVPCGPCLFLW